MIYLGFGWLNRLISLLILDAFLSYKLFLKFFIQYVSPFSSIFPTQESDNSNFDSL